MKGSSDRLPAQQVSTDFIESKVQYLQDVHLWPERQALDPQEWLRNFRDVEQPYALNLLNVFLYFNEPLIDALFRAAVQGLSAELTAAATSLADAKARWRTFLARVRVTYVEGEQPRPTDSGIVFARKARQVLHIDEDQIVDPARALRALLDNPQCPVLFVDDFVGGGSQMSATWLRPYPIGTGQSSTFAAAAQYGSYIVYTPLVATTHGLDVLALNCPGLKVRPAHSLDARYSLTAPDSVLWPDALRPSATAVLFEASKRAGIVEECKYGWKGFQELALALAFWHSVPDATLPLLFWDRRGWAPLIRRT